MYMYIFNLQNLQKVIDQTGVKGFADVVVTESVTSGLCHL